MYSTYEITRFASAIRFHRSSPLLLTFCFPSFFLVTEMKGRIRMSGGGSVLVEQLDTAISVGEQLLSVCHVF